MEDGEKIESIIEALTDLSNDTTIPKNVKQKLIEVIDILKDEDYDLSLKVNKSLDLLEEISEDPALQSYTRTQIWNIVSLLESL